ncbi:zeta-crystallin-like [Octopus sinensis]|uniref:Zeta-crystallin-like n=1 Tax=Octopus sinensis TaxID=2607531 RepID=A0A7E6EL98_9MOLL|nr:zeta-crystallin-like [Octopus sinensis]
MLLSETELHVRVDSKESITFSTNAGTPKRDTLSPVLFIVYLEVVLRDLREQIECLKDNLMGLIYAGIIWIGLLGLISLMSSFTSFKSHRYLGVRLYVNSIDQVMQSCIVSKPSGNIEIVTRPIPEISPDQVLVQVKAAGVNPVDTYIRSGVFFPNQPYPYTPGIDGAGIITKVGANCKNQNINDRVYIFKATSPYGTYSEYCVAESSCVMPLHPNLTFEQGAALGIPYYSAHRALFFWLVGIAACEIALAAGMEVYGTAGTNAGRTMLLKLGVRKVYNHKENDYIQTIIVF